MADAHRRLEALLDQGVKGAVVRAEDRHGRILFECAAGIMRSDRRRPMTPDDRFHVASVTKTMTAIAVLQILEDRLPDALDRPIAVLDVLPAAIIDRLACRNGERLGDQITVRHLMTHTSGMLDVFTDGNPAVADVERLEDYILGAPERRSKVWRSWDPERPNDPDAGVLNYYLNSGHADHHLHRPGAAFHYSDTGYVLLAILAEQLSGQSLGELLRTRVFAPAGMEETYLAFALDPVGLPNDRYPEADVWKGDLPLISAGYSLSADWGGGGIVSTAQDLGRCLRGLFSGLFFNRPETLAQMTDWLAPPGLSLPRTGVGLGMHRFASHRRELWGHTGSWGARMLMEPQSGVVLTGTINQAQGPWNWHDTFLELALEQIERNTETSR